MMSKNVRVQIRTDAVIQLVTRAQNDANSDSCTGWAEQHHARFSETHLIIV